jgi:hypothetical protein
MISSATPDWAILITSASPGVRFKRAGSIAFFSTTGALVKSLGGGAGTAAFVAAGCTAG